MKLTNRNFYDNHERFNIKFDSNAFLSEKNCDQLDTCHDLTLITTRNLYSFDYP